MREILLIFFGPMSVFLYRDKSKCGKMLTGDEFDSYYSHSFLWLKIFSNEKSGEN